MLMMRFLTVATSAMLVLAATSAGAVALGFVEGFDADVAGWEDNANNPLTYVASGGADGGGYASTTFSYLGYENAFGGGPVAFRASFPDDPSGGAFVGDWIDEGVGAIQVSFRHDAPEPLSLFLRVASQFNFPGAVLDAAVSVPSGVWTEVLIPIDLTTPPCTPEGTSCAAVFGAVETLQFGTDAPLGLIDDDVAYTLDIDRITIVPVPEPGTALLMGLGLSGLAIGGRRRDVA